MAFEYLNEAAEIIFLVRDDDGNNGAKFDECG
jgi:hypothetical protein